MTSRAARLAPEPDVPPGDDLVPAPAPVDEEPPPDRFCDLVLTGGVASGVVYPWAIVEIARAFRFRNIGGTSVGAMAAALAAAAEYGRRHGVKQAFEPLRRAPASLADVQADGRTRMLSLFQTNEQGQRLIRLWGKLAAGSAGPEPTLSRAWGLLREVYRETLADSRRRGDLYGGLVGLVFGLTAGGGLATVTAMACDAPHADVVLWAFAAAALSGTVVGSIIGAAVWAELALWCAIVSDICRGLIRHEYGLCKGGTTGFPVATGQTGIVEWLHKGIQTSAGLDINDDPPLTFRDLWCAPAFAGAARSSCDENDPDERRSINLQMVTTNVTHGRPYRLPLNDVTSTLYYKPTELEGYFPACVLEALDRVSQPYRPRRGRLGLDPDADHESAVGLRELPGADLPIVVAARLSLSFPLLFSAVPLWAIDEEIPRRRAKQHADEPDREQRWLRRCMFSDGGISSNFPIHLFDSSLPRWPTFGLWLDRRSPYWHPADDASLDEREQRPETEVWLPQRHDHGRGDSWNRFDRQSRAPDDHPRRREKVLADRAPPAQAPIGDTPSANGPFLHQCYRRWRRVLRAVGLRLDLGGTGKVFGFMVGLATSAMDWRDRTSFRLPHVRNRVARILLLPREGGLHIGMGRSQILDMAHRYGTATGKAFVARFAGNDGQPTQAWNEQRWVRFNLLVAGLRERLRGLAQAAAWPAHATPLRAAIDSAQDVPPVSGPTVRRIRESKAQNEADRETLNGFEADALMRALGELERLESVLLQTPEEVYMAEPMPELRLRAPL